MLNGIFSKITLTPVYLTKSEVNAGVADFSNAVVQNNKDFEYGDQITYFLLTQHINTVTCTPIADVETKCATPHGT